MGIGYSIFTRSSFSKDSSSALMQAGDISTLPDIHATKPLTGTGHAATSAEAPIPLPDTSTNNTKTAAAPAPAHTELDPPSSPQKRPKFTPQTILIGTKRDSSPFRWRADYPASPIKTVQTSTSSFMMNSETVIAYPSPAKLHSPPLSYANNFNKVSPVHHDMDDYRGTDPLPYDYSPGVNPFRHQSALFYDGIPSPSWPHRGPLNSRSPGSSSSRSSLRRQGSWKQVWGPDDRNSTRRKERLYYSASAEEDKLYERASHEMRYY